MAQCSGKKSSGSQCLNSALKGKKRCFWHSKESKAKIKAAGVKGGKGKKRIKLVSLPRVESSKDIIKLLNKALGEIEKIPYPDDRATLILRAVNMATKALTTSDLEDRLALLEDRIMQMNRGRK